METRSIEPSGNSSPSRSDHRPIVIISLKWPSFSNFSFNTLISLTLVIQLMRIVSDTDPGKFAFLLNCAETNNTFYYARKNREETWRHIS